MVIIIIVLRLLRPFYGLIFTTIFTLLEETQSYKSVYIYKVIALRKKKKRFFF